MLTQISSIIVSLLFVYTISFKTIITTNFFINQDDIIELFCINKDKPQLQCNGKCHLAKELVKVETQNEDQPFSQNKTEYNIELTFNITEKTAIPSESLQNAKKNRHNFSENIISLEYCVLTPPPKS